MLYLFAINVKFYFVKTLIFNNIEPTDSAFISKK